MSEQFTITAKEKGSEYLKQNLGHPWCLPTAAALERLGPGGVLSGCGDVCCRGWTNRGALAGLRPHSKGLGIRVGTHAVIDVKCFRSGMRGSSRSTAGKKPAHLSDLLSHSDSAEPKQEGRRERRPLGDTTD